MGHGGIAVYARELGRALVDAFPDDEYVLFEHTLRRPEVRERWAHGTGRSLFAALRARAGAPVERLVGRFDVLHLTDYAMLHTGRPVVSMVHDVCFETHPDCYPKPMRERLRAVTRRLLEVSAHVVVPSERTRRELLARFGAQAERVHATPLGRRPLPGVVGVSTARPPFVLVVGTLMPRKNHVRLIEAFQGLGDPDVKLVIAGARGFGDEAIVDAARQSTRLVFVEAPDDIQLTALYHAAAVVAVPSLDEGFGLPVVEALAMGKPVLVGKDTTCADVAGDAALAVDAQDVDALRDGLRRLLTDEELRARLAERGPSRASRFTWDATARATRAVYEQALS